LRYYRTTGLIFTQTQELVRRVNGALDKPWSKRVGRPKSLGLYKEHYSKPHVIEKKKSARAASNASW
jgi:hypothetical protein